MFGVQNPHFDTYPGILLDMDSTDWTQATTGTPLTKIAKLFFGLHLPPLFGVTQKNRNQARCFGFHCALLAPVTRTGELRYELSPSVLRETEHRPCVDFKKKTSPEPITREPEIKTCPKRKATRLLMVLWLRVRRNLARDIFIDFSLRISWRVVRGCAERPRIH